MGIIADNKVDNSTAMTKLTGNLTSSSPWIKVINDSIEACMNESKLQFSFHSKSLLQLKRKKINIVLIMNINSIFSVCHAEIVKRMGIKSTSVK